MKIPVEILMNGFVQEFGGKLIGKLIPIIERCESVAFSGYVMRIAGELSILKM
ncbi:MAG TPA: hypothetical protein VG272_03400 [Candidatus Acidoferrales bacterium]|jgi:hypothetical protein|nr:hypothetical protein [Candidatus Acidoferrales bacterium]